MSDVPLHQQLQAHAGGLVRLKLARGVLGRAHARALQWNDRIGLLLGGKPSAPNAASAWVFVLIDGSPQSILVLRDEVEFIGGDDV